MSKSVNLQGQPFHFIGVGGIGMSALAYILAERNIPVSGSDIRATHITQRLASAGASIFTEQRAENLSVFAQIPPSPGSVHSASTATISVTATPASVQVSAPQVVCSTAIHPDNAEYCAAREQGYPIFHRSDVLAALLQEYESIAVAGTHGKTTTSSLIAYILLHGGIDPTVVVGGEVDAIGGNARLGQSRYLVAEADESDGSLIKMRPWLGIVTNIELDHPDHYKSVEAVIEVFKTFEQNTQVLIGCVDSELVRSHFSPEITYSLDPNQPADYTATNIQYHGTGTTAQIVERGQVLGQLHLPLLGAHNLSNTLAAIAAARQTGLSFDAIADAIAEFQGAKRRFEVRGQANGITFIDDYAHHPSELQATLAAARLRVTSAADELPQRLVAIFQPHRYSRTLTFLQEFAQSFQDADVVVITDIYSAGEANPHNVSGQMLVDAIAEHHPQVIYKPTLPDVRSFLQEFLQSGDFALFLGAGNLNQQITPLVEYHTHHQV